MKFLRAKPGSWPILYSNMAIRPKAKEHASCLLSILGDGASNRSGPMTAPMSDRYREEP